MIQNLKNNFILKKKIIFWQNLGNKTKAKQKLISKFQSLKTWNLEKAIVIKNINLYQFLHLKTISMNIWYITVCNG
jgi:hypothetical protein